MTTHIIMLSGGVGSWATARTVQWTHPSDRRVHAFADTLMEDEDLYRFMDDIQLDLGGEHVRLEEGRDPWQVFRDVRFIGNTRADPCSRILKRELLRGWLEANFQPEGTVVYLGFDWTEMARLHDAARFWAPWTVRAPLTEPPWQKDKGWWLAQLDGRGIKVPRLYEMGFVHNNCGGFCIKAGQAHFARLLREMPERYAHHEAKEREMRVFLRKNVAILRDRRGGTTKPMTMRRFRERVEAGDYDKQDWGGCSCFTPPAD